MDLKSKDITGLVKEKVSSEVFDVLVFTNKSNKLTISHKDNPHRCCFAELKNGFLDGVNDIQDVLKYCDVIANVDFKPMHRDKNFKKSDQEIKQEYFEKFIKENTKYPGPDKKELRD